MKQQIPTDRCEIATSAKSNEEFIEPLLEK
jgi:hypothetical protein